MKRYPVVIGVTIAGVAAVLSFRSHDGTFGSLNGSHVGTASASHSHSSGTTHATSTSPPAGSSSNGTASTSATGMLEQYGYGQLSVRVTMSGGTITTVALATLQTAETYSQQLADQVVPVLQREVLSAQSAKINGVSGATYTSEAYAYSVQSALDKLRR